MGGAVYFSFFSKDSMDVCIYCMVLDTYEGQNGIFLSNVGSFIRHFIINLMVDCSI